MAFKHPDRRYFRLNYTFRKQVGGVVTTQNPRGDVKNFEGQAELLCFTTENKFVNKHDTCEMLKAQLKADSVNVDSIYEFKDMADFDEWQRIPKDPNAVTLTVVKDEK
jgi:hypothetical protein